MTLVLGAILESRSRAADARAQYERFLQVDPQAGEVKAKIGP